MMVDAATINNGAIKTISKIDDPTAYLMEHGVPLGLISKIAEKLDLSIRELAEGWESSLKFGYTDAELLDEYRENYPECFSYSQPVAKIDFLGCIKSLDEFEEKDATWLVPSLIPEGQITLLAADGGVGKTTLWVDIAAAISAGKPCVLDPVGFERKPGKVLFLTTEDSVEKKLKRKLRLAGANMQNIFAPDFASDRDNALGDVKFGSEELKTLIRAVEPVLCIFDPVQGFVPAEINMGSRNAMRNCMAPLIALGEETGCSFIVVCHSNKRKNAFGRDRIADSADLWDIARSVLMAGNTDNGIKYLSQEKNNYDQLHETLLFSIDSDGIIHKEGTTWKKDREFMSEYSENRSPHKAEDCADNIIDVLKDAGGEMRTSALEDKLADMGFSDATIRRAKDKLKADSKINYSCSGYGKEKTWSIKLVDYAPEPVEQITELPF